ncbi:MAG: hypothetical protein P8X84_03160, partial [Candidatus Bathyarchaeota archaeon]
MNKKIFLAVFLILATMIVSAFPVYAGKGTTKVEFVMTFVDQSLNFFEPPVVTGQNRHASIWYNLGDIGIVTLTIDQGAEVYYGYGAHYPDGEPTTISPVSDFEYYSEMEVEVHQVNDEEKDFGNLHWWYTLDFGDGNVITVKCNGKNYRTTPTTSWG